ncbi:hypothetical protein [Haloferula sp.]|uniref:hypothetical protein n=1 Tax=Haloferula sp. TaxID=2497595 RepID=UPI003C753DB3
MDFLDDDLFSDDDVFHFFIDDWKDENPEDDAPKTDITDTETLCHWGHLFERLPKPTDFPPLPPLNDPSDSSRFSS